MRKPRTIPHVYQDGLSLLHEFFGLTSSTNRTCDTPDTDTAGGDGPCFDGVIISIDFENIKTIRTGFHGSDCCQMGIALLDSRDITRLPASKAISTINYATGTPRYVSRASRKYLFGDTISCHRTELAAHVRSYFPVDENRQIIIIGYSVEIDIHALRALGFEFPTCSMFILDTFRIAKDVMSGWTSSLARLLDLFGVQYPPEALHCAGNDAHLTLKALLLLGERDYLQRVPAPSQKDLDTLAFIHDVAMRPVMGVDSRNSDIHMIIPNISPPRPGPEA